MASQDVIRYATAAVKADHAGQIVRAISMYEKTVKALLSDVKSRPLTEKQKQGFKARAAQYMKRIKELKQKHAEDMNFASSFPPPPQKSHTKGSNSVAGGDPFDDIDLLSGPTYNSNSGNSGTGMADLFDDPAHNTSYNRNNNSAGIDDLFDNHAPGTTKNRNNSHAGLTVGAAAMGLAASNPGAAGSLFNYAKDNPEDAQKQLEMATRAAKYAQENPETARRAMAAVQSGGAMVTQADKKIEQSGGFKRVMQVGGAGAAVGAVAGLTVLGAPVLLAVGGLGGGIYAATRGGKTGENALSAGDAFSSGVSSTREFNRKHQVTDKAWDLTKRGASSAVDFNEDYDVTGKVSTAAGKVWSGTKKAGSAIGDFNEEHDVTGHIARGASYTWSAAKSGASATAEFNEKYGVTDTIGNAASSSWGAMKSLWKKGTGSKDESS